MPTRPKQRQLRRSCLGCLLRVIFTAVFLLMLGAGAVIFYFLQHPPFGSQTVARVLVVGLDEPELSGGPRRSDAIILFAARLDGGRSLLLSVPRDARVRLPHQRRQQKINAAYAVGQVGLLKETLADSDVLGAGLPYHLVMDSRTVREVVDAFGGVTITVPHDMNYDDHWGHLSIHLRAGRQRLNGEQVVGFLRWRKDTRGGIRSTDFARSDRQRALLIALAEQARTREGLRRLPAVYRAFQRTTHTNLTLPQFAALGLAFKHVQSAAVTGDTRTIGGISYVLCDWAEGRRLWEQAIR